MALSEEERLRRKREAQARYKAKYPGRQQENYDRWRKANPEKAKAATKAWRERNPEKIKAADKAKWADPEKRAKNQAYYREWSKRNKEKLAAKSIDNMHRGRVISPDLAGHFTLDEWNAMLDEYDHRCGYCGVGGVRLDRDHIVPLSRGGRHDASNIIPACRSCNMRKGTRLPDEWLAA